MFPRPPRKLSRRALLTALAGGALAGLGLCGSPLPATANAEPGANSEPGAGLLRIGRSYLASVPEESDLERLRAQLPGLGGGEGGRSQSRARSWAGPRWPRKCQPRDARCEPRWWRRRGLLVPRQSHAQPPCTGTDLRYLRHEDRQTRSRADRPHAGWRMRSRRVRQTPRARSILMPSGRMLGPCLEQWTTQPRSARERERPRQRKPLELPARPAASSTVYEALAGKKDMHG